MITVEVPRLWLLTANQKLHWRAAAKRRSLLRTTARLHGLNVRRTDGFAMFPYPNRVRAIATIAWPDRRKRDAHNLQVIKPIIDGIVDAGILIDDSDHYMIGPDLRVSDEQCDKDLACTVTITFEEA